MPRKLTRRSAGGASKKKTTKKKAAKTTKKPAKKATPAVAQAALDPSVELLGVDEVEIGWRARTDLGDIADLVSSIAELGQIHPIRVCQNGQGKPELVAGMRRLEACRKLGIPVRAEIVTRGEYLGELKRQLHENMQRKDFDALEEGEGLRKLKTVYEELHPETKHGGDRKNVQVAESATCSAPRFTLEAAKTYGCSERKVQELLAIAALPKKYKAKIEAAKSTAERKVVIQECLAKVREDNKLAKLQTKIEAKRQLSIEDQLEADKGRPAIVLHHGPNEDFLKGEELYDVCLTDPPYDRERNIISHVARASINPKAHKWDKLDVGWVMRAAPTLKPGGSLIVFCPLEAIGAYELVCQAAGLEYRQAMLWVKTNPAPVHRPVYATAVEAIIWATKPGEAYYFSPNVKKAGAESTNVFTGPGVPGSAADRVHPTQKPDWLVRQLLDNHASVELGHHVVDPFAGSGTTGVVCQDKRLACTMIEVDDDYVKKARLRLEASR